MANDDQLPANWSDEAKFAFSRMYRHTSENQDLFTHPDMAPMPQYQWETVCWNMAWIAAGVAVNSEQFIHTDEDGNILAAEVMKENMQ